MGLRETTMKHLLVSENYRNNLRYIYSNLRTLHFYSCVSPSAASRTISDITLNSASSISIRSQHTAERDEDREWGRYNRLTREYSSGNLPNGKRCLKTRLWFCKVCNIGSTIIHTIKQVGRDCFATHHDSLVRLPWNVCSCHSIFVCCLIRPYQWWLTRLAYFCYDAFHAYDYLQKAWSELNQNDPLFC